MNRLLSLISGKFTTKLNLSYLKGGGTRMLVVLNNGDVDAQAIPSGSGGGGGGLGDPSANGFVVRNNLNQTIARTLTGTANEIVVQYGDGISGNPTFSIGSNVVTLAGSQTLTNKTLGAGSKINLGTVAAGDMYYGDGSGNLIRVPRGTIGTVWTVINSSALGWAAPSGGGGGPVSTVYLDANDFAGSGTSDVPFRLKTSSYIADPMANGWLIRTGAGTAIPRVPQVTAGHIVIQDADGQAKAPTFSLGSLAVRTDNAQTIAGQKTFSQDILMSGIGKSIVIADDSGAYWRLRVTTTGTPYFENLGA